MAPRAENPRDSKDQLSTVKKLVLGATALGMGVGSILGLTGCGDKVSAEPKPEQTPTATAPQTPGATESATSVPTTITPTPSASEVSPTPSTPEVTPTPEVVPKVSFESEYEKFKALTDEQILEFGSTKTGNYQEIAHYTALIWERSMALAPSVLDYYHVYVNPLLFDPKDMSPEELYVSAYSAVTIGSTLAESENAVVSTSTWDKESANKVLKIGSEIGVRYEAEVGSISEPSVTMLAVRQDMVSSFFNSSSEHIRPVNFTSAIEDGYEFIGDGSVTLNDTAYDVRVIQSGKSGKYHAIIFVPLGEFNVESPLNISDYGYKPSIKPGENGEAVYEKSGKPVSIPYLLTVTPKVPTSILGE